MPLAEAPVTIGAGRCVFASGVLSCSVSFATTCRGEAGGLAGGSESEWATQTVGNGPHVLPARWFGAGCPVSLSLALGESGWDVVLASGSLGWPGEQTHAATFFEGLQVEVADYTPAFERFGLGEDQLVGPVPFHGSFEDREGAPDPVFAALSREQGEAQVSAWEGVFERAGLGNVDLIHLHHLTPMHDAAARLWPERALVTHLHGTELKMLHRVKCLDGVAVALDTGLDRLAAAVEFGELAPDRQLPERERELPRRTKLSRYRYGKEWAARLEASARHSRRIICISPHGASEAVRLLGIPEGLIEVIPNGVDTDRFDR
ncbi:MAG: hypothetical protein E6G60_15015 [Actinobacteria bacterium]|nr:MAG: hypothetical protein E6G60_15015 [Actinomycetota bacterium]